MPIRTLPPLLVNQIAAGEVIERPASVVKELIENSLDAGATRIDVTIENGGIDLIQVADNGSGIPSDELPLAIAPHATSKLASADDLASIATLGFRGEALASIASVSRLSIVSRTAAQAEGGIIETEGDITRPPRPHGSPVGTTITVRNLFFNTPARRKFLRTEQTEAMRISEVVQHLAMAHPSVSFALRAGDRSVLEAPPAQSPRDRVLALLGPELSPDMLELSVDDRGLRLWGMIGTPEIARGTARHQRIFLNGRLIADRSTSHAIKEAYRGLTEPDRWPVVVLCIGIDPSQVDVNVHPTKSEVRFRNQAAVHGAVLAAVRQRLREADLIPAISLSDPSGSGGSGASSSHLPLRAGSMIEPLPAMRPAASSPSQPSRSEFVEYFRRLDPMQKGFVYGEVRQALAEVSPELLERDASQSTNGGHHDELPSVRPVSEIMQVHASYIVTKDEQGLLIIDQHALHERIMFEKLKAQLTKATQLTQVTGGPGVQERGGSLESQRLLMPATLELEPAQLELLGELRSTLQRLGIEVESIGPRSVGVHAFTSLLFSRGVEPAEFLRDLLDRAARHGINHDPEAALHEVLDMMACKAAIKAGDRLSHAEIADLLRQRESVERSSNCPHGRPTTLRLTIRDLDRQFGRT
jgi:DNA mismatch repair protein MutL